MAKPPTGGPGEPGAPRTPRPRRKSRATSMVEGVAAVMTTVAEEAARADEGAEAAPAAAPAAAGGRTPPPPHRRTLLRAPRRPAGRGPGIAKTLGSVAPLAVSALAMAVPQHGPAVALPKAVPSVSIGAGGFVPPALRNNDLPNPPPDSVSPQCAKQFSTIDLPVHRGDDVARRQTRICREGYLLSFNVDTRSPDWVVERLSPADLVGPASRANNFSDDPALKPDADASNPDYLKTGFDRGHQAPAADAKFNQIVMNESFYFTNMSPQRGIGMNRGAWKYLEETVRSWVLCGGHPDLYVITGPIYGSLEGNPATIGNPPIAVPRAYYKIVYDPNLGRAVGFVLPNTKIGSRIELQDYVWRIADIETDTGLNFFAGLPQRLQAELKDDPGVAWAHNGTCPGDTGE